jgi:hypothetical protein
MGVLDLILFDKNYLYEYGGFCLVCQENDGRMIQRKETVRHKKFVKNEDLPLLF